MSSTAAYAFYLCSLVLVATSQLLIKWVMNLSSADENIVPSFSDIVMGIVQNPIAWLAIVMFGIGGIFWYLSMLKLPLTLMLPVSASIAPLVSIGAHFFLGEPLPPVKIAAIMLIAFGVAWLAWLST